MKKGLRIGILLLLLILAGAAFVYGAEPPITLELDGQVIETDVPPLIQNGRTLIPARAFFEAMGGEVGWDAESQVVTVTLG